MKVLALADEFPGSRHLLTRKTRVSMTESVLELLETALLPQMYPELLHRANRSHRTKYRLPNGSEIIIAGLDEPTRIRSSQYDTISVFEATEITEAAWDELSTGRLRHGHMRHQGRLFHQALADCNPAVPTHWLKERADAGKITRYASRHEDNPALYDSKRGCWTELGQDYMGRLQRLTGTRRERYLLGMWVAAEGLVYAAFNERRHVAKQLPEVVQYYRTIDWGYGVFVCLWLAVAPIGQVEVAYLVDTYRAEQGTLGQHAAYLKRHKLQDVQATYCDPSGRNRNDQTGRSNVEQLADLGIRCTYTTNPRWVEVANGIRLIQDALDPPMPPDRLRYLPTPNNRTFLRDIESYVNRQVNGIYLDEPVKPQPADHTMDALRYFFVNRMARRGPARAVGFGVY